MSAPAMGSGQDPDARVQSLSSRTGSLAGRRFCPGGHAAAAPAACPPPLGPTADSDVILLQEHLTAAAVDIPGAPDALRLDSLPMDTQGVFGSR